MSELNAAMGLAMLPYMDKLIQQRRHWYQKYLKETDFSVCVPVSIRPGTDWNYAYAPVLFHSEERLMTAMHHMSGSKIIPRRYFYPSLHHLPFMPSSDMPISEDISRRILCLPLHHELNDRDFARILDALHRD